MTKNRPSVKSIRIAKKLVRRMGHIFGDGYEIDIARALDERYEHGVRDSAKKCDDGEEGGWHFADKILSLLPQANNKPQDDGEREGK